MRSLKPPLLTDEKAWVTGLSLRFGSSENHLIGVSEKHIDGLKTRVSQNPYPTRYRHAVPKCESREPKSFV